MAGNYSNTGSWTPQVNTVGLNHAASYEGLCTPFVHSGVIWAESQLASSSPAGAAGTSTTHTIEFPFVTRRVKVKNERFFNSSSPSAKTLRVTLGHPSASTGVNTWNGSVGINDSPAITNRNFVVLGPDEEVTIDIKCKEIYLSVSYPSGYRSQNYWVLPYTVFAELTNIPSGKMYTLTGAGINQ